MTSLYWEPLFKWSPEDADYELSVIAKNNEHGHESWGWCGWNEEKIVLFTPDHLAVNGKREDEYPDKHQRKIMKQITVDFCAYMNEKYPNGLEGSL